MEDPGIEGRGDLPSPFLHDCPSAPLVPCPVLQEYQSARSSRTRTACCAHAAPRPGLGARCALCPKLHFSRLFLLPRTLAQTSTEPTFPSARYPSSVLSRLPHHDLCPSALPQKQAARPSILIASRAHRQRRLRLCHLYGRTVRTGPQECSVSAYLTKRCEEMSWHCTPGPEKPLLEISSFI